MRYPHVYTVFATVLLSLLPGQAALTEPARPTEQGDRLATEQPVARGRVVKAVFTTSMVDGEPVDDLTEIMNTSPEVFFFTDLQGLAGQTITHRWKYGDTIVANAKIEVKSARFQTWSSYTMQPEWTGAWFVEVLDQHDTVIATRTFAFTAPL